MKHISAIVLAVALAGTATTLPAHHSMASYDQSTLVLIKGVINKIEWVNPHSRITLSVTNTDGKTNSQQIDIAGPSALMMRGVDTKAFTIGSTVTFEAWMAKDSGPSTPPYGRTLILADGRRFDLGDNFGDIFNSTAH